jgi:glutamate/tyrosine decarboxylase-like PLP-dependent enzyme
VSIIASVDTSYDVLDDATRLARAFLDDLPERPVGAREGLDALRARLHRPLTQAGEDPRAVLAELAQDLDPGLVASAGPRYFGFVIGGTLPVALAADWLTSAYDQNAGGYGVSPGVSVAEEAAQRWVLDLLRLPRDAGVGFVTGCQMAHVTCLAAARHGVLRDAGWDVEREGLHGAPALQVICGAYAHVTVEVACRMLGIGTANITRVDTDDQGRMRPDALEAALRDRRGAPTIVCAQAGEVNTGAFDDLSAITALAREHGAWCHVDGAFGLWAAASAQPERRALVQGLQEADSWATDAHKWLNVPYDCGIAIVADAGAHRAAMTSTAAYIPLDPGGEPWALHWTPEFSRRARGVPLYAALRALGRDGVAELIDRCCAHARDLAERLAGHDGVTIVNDVVLNQVLLRFDDDDAATGAVIDHLQREGTCYPTPSAFGGATVMRVSIVNWQTTAADIERSAAAVLRAHAAVRA